MKQIILTIIIFLSLITYPTIKHPSLASTKQTFYAKADNPLTYFYTSPTKGDDYKLFEIPKSYFVLLYDNANEFFYKAKYCDIEGYVLKDSVTPVNESPNYPFANSTFRVFAGTNLYSSTQKESLIISNLSPLSSISTFYGQKHGEELIPNSTDIWYYCSYYEDGARKTGYIFSYYCDQFQPIQPNSEIVSPILGDIKFEAPDTLTDSEVLSSTTKTLIAVSCIVPCLIILLLLLKKRTSTKKEKKLLRKPRKDFYEFNEDDI